MCTNIFFYILNMGPSFNECMRTIYIKLQMYKYNVCRFFFLISLIIIAIMYIIIILLIKMYCTNMYV